MSTKTPIYNIEEHPSFRGVINEVKVEIRDFLNTRWMLLKTELKEKSAVYMKSLPLVLIGGAFLLLSLVFLNFAILALIASAFAGGIISWCYSAAILFGIYALLGGGFYVLGMGKLKSNSSLVPTHTLNVLKQDQQWLQQEANTQL